MSIILRALKNEAEKKPSSKAEEGFFKGDNPYIEESTLFEKIKDKKFYIVTGLIVFVTSFYFVSWYLKRPSHSDVPLPEKIATEQQQVEPVAQSQVEPVPQPQVSQEAEQPQVDLSDIVKRARDSLKSGDNSGAVELFKKAIEQDQNDPMLHNGLGLSYFKSGLLSNAEDEYRKAIELDGDCVECLNNLGVLKSNQGNISDSKASFERAISIDTEYPEPYFNLGVLYEKNGDVGNAVKFYQQFIGMQSDKGSEMWNKVKRRIDELSGK